MRIGLRDQRLQLLNKCFARDNQLCPRHRETLVPYIERCKNARVELAATLAQESSPLPKHLLYVVHHRLEAHASLDEHLVKIASAFGRSTFDQTAIRR